MLDQIISDTIQLGGVLVFLRDQKSKELAAWVKPLEDDQEHIIPFVLRDIVDLQSAKFKTRPEDLIIFLKSQKNAIKVGITEIDQKSLNQVLQGQRVLLGDSTEEIGFDFVFSDVSLEKWSDVLNQAKKNLVFGCPLREPLTAQESPCLFLDRDDVVVRNVPYNNNPEMVELVPGVTELISRAHELNYWVAIVTNQSGIGRGRITWQEYKSVHQKMLQLLADQNCWIDECVWASFIENEAVIEGRLFAGLRKPRAGMFQLVHDKLRTQMTDSIMVGDSATDLIAAHSAGVGHLYLLYSDKFNKEEDALREYQKDVQSMHFHVLNELKDLSLRKI